jgi:magnesium transporter
MNLGADSTAGGGWPFPVQALSAPDRSQVDDLGLPELVIDDLVRPHHRPRVDRYDGALVAILKPARYVDSAEVVETGDLVVVVQRDRVVLVSHDADLDASSIMAACADSDLAALGPEGVLVAAVRRTIAGYAPVVAGIEVDIEQVEEQVFASARLSPTERIYYLKREVLAFARAAGPLTALLTVLVDDEPAQVSAQTRVLLRDALGDLLRVVDQIHGQRDLLTSVLEANLTQVSVRQNEDMRKISAWVAIVAVPTLIAGVYGMNFEHMPELEQRWGYPLVLAVMLLICTVLYRQFRRSGWL